MLIYLFIRDSRPPLSFENQLLFFFLPALFHRTPQWRKHSRSHLFDLPPSFAVRKTPTSHSVSSKTLTLTLIPKPQNPIATAPNPTTSSSASWAEQKHSLKWSRYSVKCSKKRDFALKKPYFATSSFYGRARMPGSAIRTFESIPSFRCHRSIRSFNSLLDAFLNCGDVKKIAELCRDLGNLCLKPDACTYNILVRSASSLDRALNLFDEMRSRGIEPSVVTFGTLISALCKNKKLDLAFELKEEMLRSYNLKPNVYIYTSLIKALCKDGRLDDALCLKNEITGLDSAVDSTLIRALFKVARKGEVVGILEEMKRSGVKPDVVTCKAMIVGFWDDRDFVAAFEAVDEMKKEGK